MALDLPKLGSDLLNRGSMKSGDNDKSDGRPVGSDPFTSVLTSLLSGGSKSGAMPGLDWMGNFDSDSFIGSTLAKNRGADSSNLTQLIGGLLSL